MTPVKRYDTQFSYLVSNPRSSWAVFGNLPLRYEALRKLNIGYWTKLYSDIRYNVGLCAPQSDIGRSDIRLSPISLITDNGLSAHLWITSGSIPMCKIDFKPWLIQFMHSKRFWSIQTRKVLLFVIFYTLKGRPTEGTVFVFVKGIFYTWHTVCSIDLYFLPYCQFFFYWGGGLTNHVQEMCHPPHSSIVRGAMYFTLL